MFPHNRKLFTVNSFSITNKFSGNVAASEKVVNDSSGRIVAWHIVVSILSGIIIGIPISYIVWRFYPRWVKNSKPNRNRDGQQKEADAVYQELNLPTLKIGNSSSLTGNASSMYEAVDDSDSNYAALSKIRDPENVYQSLY